MKRLQNDDNSSDRSTWTVEQVRFMLKTGVLLKMDMLDVVWAYEAFKDIRPDFHAKHYWNKLWTEKVKPMFPEGQPFKHFGDERKNCLAWYFAFRLTRPIETERVYGTFRKRGTDSRIYVQLFQGIEKGQIWVSLDEEDNDAMLAVRKRVVEDLNLLMTLTLRLELTSVRWSTNYHVESLKHLAHVYYILMDMGYYLLVAQQDDTPVAIRNHV